MFNAFVLSLILYVQFHAQQVETGLYGEASYLKFIGLTICARTHEEEVGGSLSLGLWAFGHLFILAELRADDEIESVTVGPLTLYVVDLLAAQLYRLSLPFGFRFGIDLHGTFTLTRRCANHGSEWWQVGFIHGAYPGYSESWVLSYTSAAGGTFTHTYASHPEAVAACRELQRDGYQITDFMSAQNWAAKVW